MVPGDHFHFHPHFLCLFYGLGGIFPGRIIQRDQSNIFPAIFRIGHGHPERPVTFTCKIVNVLIYICIETV